MDAADAPKGPKTETVTREYDAAGKLLSETVVTVVTVTPEGAAEPHPGCFP